MQGVYTHKKYMYMQYKTDADIQSFKELMQWNFIKKSDCIILFQEAWQML